MGQDLSLFTSQRPQNDLDLWGLNWSELGQACPVGIMDSGSVKAFCCECQRQGLDRGRGAYSADGQRGEDPRLGLCRAQQDVADSVGVRAVFITVQEGTVQRRLD